MFPIIYFFTLKTPNLQSFKKIGTPPQICWEKINLLFTSHLNVLRVLIKKSHINLNMYGTSFEYYIAQSDVSVYTKDLRGAGRHKLQRQSELNQMFNIFIVFDSIMI